uniref:Egg protein CP391S-like protein n=1 Tax=Schistosoma mansoni TaxID=6183 RepID=A0AA82N866_SCHMA
MRYNFSPSLWILIYLIFLWPYKRFKCNVDCERPNLYQYEIVIIENDTYRYSIHYKYSMRIQHNQSQPVSSDRFTNKIDYRYSARPQFSLSYYGSRVHEIRFYEHDEGKVYNFRGLYSGSIYNYIKKVKSESRVLDEKELLGVQRNFLMNVNGTEVTTTMTSLIHPSGKISFYYDNIPREIEESQLKSRIFEQISCRVGGFVRFYSILVPAKWIKSGTLVEFEAIGEICSQYNTNETCQNATISNLTCFWCEKIEKCIISNLQHTHDCRIEKTSDVNDLNSSTTTEHGETTSGITEVQVSENLMKTTEETDKQSYMTTRTTEENKQHKSHWYLYVVIPIVASLFLICIGCIIWRWLLRRKGSDE